MDKNLTIVIPTYNMERYLERCLNSLIVSDEQMRNLEVLVINDGSKDRSSEIAHTFENKYPETFRVIDKENGNYGSCVNRGLKEAAGKYIKILDADDWFNNHVFQEFIIYLTNVKSDLIISNYDIVDENGHKTLSIVFNPNDEECFSIPKSEYPWLWHHAVTYRTEIVRNINYKQTEGISYTDEEWVYKPMVSVKSVSYFKNTLYMYLRGREGQTYDPVILSKSFSQIYTVILSILLFHIEWKGETDLNICDFLHQRLLQHMSNLYDRNLQRELTVEENLAMKKLDMKLKETELYKELNELIHSNRPVFYYHIQNWRKSNYNKDGIKLKLYRGLYKLKKYIN